MKTGLLACFCLLAVCCIAQKEEQVFTVKKKQVIKEDVKLPTDTFYFGQYNINAVELSSEAEDFLEGIDSLYTGQSVTRLFNYGMVSKVRSIEATNLEVEALENGWLKITASDKPGNGEVRLLTKDSKGKTTVFYRRTIRVVSRSVARQ